jgi:hypothetical protein
MAVQENFFSGSQARYADEGERSMAASQEPLLNKTEASNSDSCAEYYDEDEYWQSDDGIHHEDGSYLGRLAGKLHQSRPVL